MDTAPMHATEFLDAFALPAPARRRASALIDQYLGGDALVPAPGRSTLNRTAIPVQLAVQCDPGRVRARLVIDPFVYGGAATRFAGVMAALTTGPLRRLAVGPAAEILDSRIAAVRADGDRAIAWFGFDLEDAARSIIYVGNQHDGALERSLELVGRVVRERTMTAALHGDLSTGRVELSAVGLCPDDRLKLYVRVRALPCATLTTVARLAPFALPGLRALPSRTGVSPQGLYVAYRVHAGTGAIEDGALELAMREDHGLPAGVFEAAGLAAPAIGPTAAPSFLCLGGAPGRARVSVYAGPATPRCAP